MKCPSCKEPNTMKPWTGKVALYGIPMTAEGTKCAKCGERLFDAEQVQGHERLAAIGITSRGIRTGPELKFVRKKTGLKASGLADLFGVTSETVSRWERGVVGIPRVVAFAVAEIYEHPRATRRKLNALGMELSYNAIRSLLSAADGVRLIRPGEGPEDVTLQVVLDLLAGILDNDPERFDEPGYLPPVIETEEGRQLAYVGPNLGGFPKR